MFSPSLLSLIKKPAHDSQPANGAGGQTSNQGPGDESGCGLGGQPTGCLRSAAFWLPAKSGWLTVGVYSGVFECYYMILYNLSRNPSGFALVSSSYSSAIDELCDVGQINFSFGCHLLGQENGVLVQKMTSKIFSSFELTFSFPPLSFPFCIISFLQMFGVISKTRVLSDI